MKTMKLVAAATLAAGLIASPAFAKDKMKNRSQVQQDYSGQMSDDGYRDTGYRDSGFWPADVAAGAVGGAVGIAGAAVNTAGAIATAPFRTWGDSYASYNGVDDGYERRDSYARLNNFVCQPGTWFRGQDGQQHICQ